MEARRTSVIVRILRLWRIHAFLDFMWMTRDTRLFVTCYVSDLFATVARVTAMLLLAARFDGIGNWSTLQILFMLGYGSAQTGILNAFFGFNVLMISRRLGRGQLDHTLIMPQPVWMTLLTEGFSPLQNSSMVLPGLALMAWAAAKLAISATPGWLALLATNMAASGIVMLAFFFLWGRLAFWYPRPAEEIDTNISSLMNGLKIFPLDGLGFGLAGSLMTLLPVGFMAWYPCRFLLGLDSTPWHGAVTPAAAVGFGLLTVWVFGKGLKHYGRTGSQRYSDYGHRR